MRKIVVFGGTGFLGRRLARHLRDHSFRVAVAARHPEQGRAILPEDDPALEWIRADVTDDRAVATAVENAFGVVNAVSLYVERGGRRSAPSMWMPHRDSPTKRGVRASSVWSSSPASAPMSHRHRSYVRSRGEGEGAVRAAFPTATLIRPAVMFGPSDAFVTPLLKLLQRLPVFALFGAGRTRLQPADVEDVAEAIARDLERVPEAATTYEFGGPRIYRYKELIEALARHVGARPLLLPMPFGLWHALAALAEMLPKPPITRNQVELMEMDSTASPDMPGLTDLGISPRSLEEALPLILRKAG